MFGFLQNLVNKIFGLHKEEDPAPPLPPVSVPSVTPAAKATVEAEKEKDDEKRRGKDCKGKGKDKK